MIRKLNDWLCEHGIFWGWEGRDGVAHIWAIIISFLALLFTGIFGWNAVFVCAILYLGSSVGLPILAGIIALIKKEKWNPWFWFPITIGCVIGGILAMFICWAFEIV